MKKILFLDFDGVLFNTVYEAYQVCINTKMFNRNILPDDSLEKFRIYRSKVGPAWNYYYIMNSIIQSKDINKDDFLYSEKAKEFEKDFFLTRGSLKKDNYIKWMQYNEKYIFLDKIKDMLDNIKVYIVTTKDKESVIDLLNNENIQFVCNENILDKEYFIKFESKANIIKNILFKSEYQAIFVDDLYSHLKECKKIDNLTLIQANWGYIDKYEHTKYLLNMNDTLSLIKKLGE